ncbi:MAG: hypothetical protein QOG87_909 [Actinomycetota bacterium]|jgi:hypothetical protein
MRAPAELSDHWSELAAGIDPALLPEAATTSLLRRGVVRLVEQRGDLSRPDRGAAPPFRRSAQPRVELDCPESDQLLLRGLLGHDHAGPGPALRIELRRRPCRVLPQGFARVGVGRDFEVFEQDAAMLLRGSGWTAGLEIGADGARLRATYEDALETVLEPLVKLTDDALAWLYEHHRLGVTLHASGIALGTAGVALCGDSGMGKTSLAGALVRSSAACCSLGDDLVIVTTANAAAPMMRRAPSARFTRNGTGPRRLEPTAAFSGRVELRMVCLLSRVSSLRVDVSEVPAQAAWATLMRSRAASRRYVATAVRRRDRALDEWVATELLRLCQDVETATVVIGEDQVGRAAQAVLARVAPPESRREAQRPSPEGR